MGLQREKASAAMLFLYHRSMTSKPSIPRPPKKPRFPSERQIRELEQRYVRRHRLPQLRAMRAVSPAAVEEQLQLEFLDFERDDVRTKSYPPGHHVIICEGDSWFNHPLLTNDIPEQLIKFGYSVLHSNRPGKYLQQSYDQALFLSPLKDPRKPQIKALLISGGGNDLINWEKGNAQFSSIFRKARSDDPTDYINTGNLKAALTAVAGWFSGIAVKLRRAHAGRLPVLLHCYDYITPKKFFPHPFKGDWVYPQLDAIGAPKDPAFRKRIAGELQRPWIEVYKETCRRLGWHFVVTQDLVHGRWHDEIHPRNDAFYDITCEYWRVLHKLGVLPSRRIVELPAAA
jgi:hypothetical protein